MFYKISSGSANDHADVCSFIRTQVGGRIQENEEWRWVTFEDEAGEFENTEALREYLQGFVTLEVPHAMFIDPIET